MLAKRSGSVARRYLFNAISSEKVIAAIGVVSLLMFPAYAANNASRSTFKVEKQQAFPKTSFDEKAIFSSDQPVLLSATQLDYDQPNDVVIATGDVEIVQGGTIILADTLIYDHSRNQVQAMGHVSMLSPSGSVYFAEALELKNNLKTGVIHQFKARLADDSIFVANGAQKVDDNVTELFKAAYSPCKCNTRTGKPKSPLWAMKAEHATIDQLAQKVYYDNATFNLYDVPILYTPYFSHSTPDADNQSGLLIPEFLQSKNLGTVFKQPVYYTFSPDRDITLTPIYTTKGGPVMAGDYRQMFDSGLMHIGGSITNAPNRDGLGNHAQGNELRGHFDGRGDFKINENYDWGFNIRRASDDTYMHLYNFSSDTLLTSKIYGEGFNFIGDYDRTYASLQGVTFQGLTGQDRYELVPVVLPLMNFNWQSHPGFYNSRFTFDGNSMVLFRETGPESRRISGTLGWKLPYISEDGQVIEFDTQLRTDIYNVSDVLLSDGRTFDGVTGREVPQASLTWRYPFINRFDTSSLLIEPIAKFTISPGGGNPEKIPNEDSLLPEFTDTNLFDSNRFAGLDRIENGARMSYGLRGQAQMFSDKYLDWLIGQQYRVINDPNFPISNDLTSHFSDYVGKIGIVSNPFTLAYRFRVDKDQGSARRNEVDASFNFYPLTLSTSYLSLRNDPVLATKEVITGGGSINLTKEWALTFSGSHDLYLDQTVTTYAGLTYNNECVNLTTMVGKDYTNLLDIKPSFSFWFRISLKNLD